VLAGALLLALAAPAATGQTLAPLPLARGAISFRVHVQMAPDFTGHVTVDSAGFTGDTLAAVRGVVVLRVDSMHTGIGLRDHHLRDAMEAKKYPEIRFELLGVTPAGAARGDTIPVTYAGRMTIHGVTRDDTIPGTAIVGKDSIEVAAAFPLDMRDYGIKPPTRLLVISVQPVVEITVRLSFAAEAGAQATDK
jgi:polyisoprenoid-binding protein YceI